MLNLALFTIATLMVSCASYEKKSPAPMNPGTFEPIKHTRFVDRF